MERSAPIYLQLFCLGLTSVWACGGDPATGGNADAGSAHDGQALPDASSPDIDAAPLADFDCATVSNAPVSTRLVPAARGYHGLVITGDGDMIGSDGSSLIKANSAGDWSVFLPGFGMGEQMDWLADGDIVAATDDGAISRIDSNGAISVIASDVYAYGVIVGPDDLIYTVGNIGESTKILRVNPNTGSKEELLTVSGANIAHSIDFNPAGDRIYVGTIGQGDVLYADFNSDMNIVGGLNLLAGDVHGDDSANGGFPGEGWHDAIGVDACGNLYVPDYNSSSLYKVSPGGETTLFWRPEDWTHYPHGLVWGSGTHGWRDDAIYLPQPYNDHTVVEIVLGVPSRDFKGTVLNKPAQKL